MTTESGTAHIYTFSVDYGEGDGECDFVKLIDHRDALAAANARADEESKRAEYLRERFHVMAKACSEEQQCKESAEQSLAAEKKLSEAISRDCNNTALERNELASQLAAERQRVAGFTLPSDGFYLQDSRTYVGNDMVWWAKDGNGYTTDLRKAHLFTAQDVAKGVSRADDIFWPASYINSLSRPAVDHQYTDMSAALKGKMG